MPLVAPEGALVAMKGSSAADEVEAARPTLEKLGCGVPEILEFGGGDPASTTRLVRVPWADPARVSWPGLTGSPRRRKAPNPPAAAKRRRPS
jgi:16S rRNA (guanine527-N7)-methyltransferase